MRLYRISIILLYVALSILAIYAAFWALFGVGEILVGNFPGAIYLTPTILLAGLMYVSFKRPAMGGAVSLLVGLALFARFYLAMDNPTDKISAALVIGGPFILVGVLLILSAAFARGQLADQNSNLP